MSRVFVFGLDAASLSLIERWKDSLPTFRKLLEEGAWGRLRSTIPPFTSPAWASMVTGKNPAKVGIFGLRHRKEGTYEFMAPTSGYRRAPAIWDIAAQFGAQVVLINVPDTYPPLPVNGALISGRPAPSAPDAAITNPVGLRAEMEEVIGQYETAPLLGFDLAARNESLEGWERALASQDAAIDYLFDREPWRLFFYVSMAIDAVSHHFWQYLDPGHPNHDPEKARRLGDTILRVYQLEDQRLKRIMARLQEDDLLMIVSDHGSTPAHQLVSVNRWLIDNGYLVLESDRPSLLRRALSVISGPIFSIYQRFPLIRTLIRPRRAGRLRNAVVDARFAARSRGRIPFSSLSVNWKETRAFYLGDNCIYLNVEGREPQGAVPFEDRKTVSEQLRSQLLAAEDGKTGAPLFKHVHLREEIYEGPYLEKAPDLILVPADEHWALGGAVAESVLSPPVVSGKHHPMGVFILSGAGVAPGKKPDASIYDIAPTVLHWLNLPVPSDVDGSVRLDWFESSAAVHQNPIDRRKFEQQDFSDFEWTESELEQVNKRLAELGYLD